MLDTDQAHGHSSPHTRYEETSVGYAELIDPCEEPSERSEDSIDGSELVNDQSEAPCEASATRTEPHAFSPDR